MNRNISLRHFRAFVAVANTGSFTLAAAELFLTQSALTATIQQFEDTIGFKLFDRSTRRVALTPVAAGFKEQAERILNQFEGAVTDLESLANGHRGHVRIAAAASVTHYFLAKAISRLKQAFPNITVSLHDEASRQIERMIINGDIDFAFASPHQQLAELVYTPIFEDRFGVLCSSTHRYARGKRPLRWQELDTSDFVAFTDDTGIGAFLRTHAARPDLMEGIRNQVSNTSSLCALLRVDGGYSILPALAAGRVEDRDLVFRELIAPALTRQVYLVTRKLRSLSPSSELLLDAMRATLHDTPVPPSVRIMDI